LTAAYVSLGDLYTASGQYDQALARLDEGLKVNPNDLSALILAATVYERKGDIRKAQEAYEKVLAQEPRFAPAANNLAWLYSEHGGDKEKALQLAQAAKEAAPEDPYVSDTLGWILYKRGVYQRALGLIRESAAKLPDNPEIQYHLGMTYYKLGDSEAARQALGKALALSPRFPGVEEAHRVLAEVR